jgi:acetyltransferase-like isoleucine patch superfamily enzyme
MLRHPPKLENDWFDRPLPANAVIGEGCYIHSAYSFLHYRSRQECGIRIGQRSGIYLETFFDVGPNGYVEVGDYCTLAGPVICTNGRVIIGDYVLISREVILADTGFARSPDEHSTFVPRSDDHTGSAAEIRVGDDAWIGSRAILLDGARIGRGAIVGAGTVVDFEVPPYAIVAGNPATVVGWSPPRRGQEHKEVGA